jgi:hypothetical protein
MKNFQCLFGSGLLALIFAITSHASLSADTPLSESPLAEEFFMTLLPPASLLAHPNYETQQPAYWAKHGAAKFEKARELLAKGVDVNHRYIYGMTALILLQMLPAVDVAPSRFLVDLGADVNATDAFGATAYHYVRCRAAWNIGAKRFLVNEFGVADNAYLGAPGSCSRSLYELQPFLLQRLQGQNVAE